MVERDVEQLIDAEVRAVLAPVLFGVAAGITAVVWLAWRRFSR